MTTPVPPELTGAEGALELLPIPALLLDYEDGRFRFEAVNSAFRLSGYFTAASAAASYRCSTRPRGCRPSTASAARWPPTA